MERYKRFGSGVPGKELSWVQMIGEIQLYTDYSVLRDRPKGSSEEQTNLKNDAEALRQFARGRMKHKTPYREISIILLKAVFSFLSHPEIDLLPADDLVPDDVPLILASHLRDYLIDVRAEKSLDEQFRLNDDHFAGVAFANPDELQTLTQEGRKVVDQNYALAHGYLHLKSCEDRCVRFVEYNTITPIWERLLADNELPASLVKKLGTGRAVPMIKSNAIETSYTGIAIVITEVAALCFVKDVKGRLSRSFLIVRSSITQEEATLWIISCSHFTEKLLGRILIKDTQVSRLLDCDDVRGAFINTPLRSIGADITSGALAILQSVTSEYFLIDKYREDVAKIVQSFDPYKLFQQQKKQDDRQQQHQQEQREVAYQERMDDPLEPEERIKEASRAMLAALQVNRAPDIWSLYHKGARFDLADPLTGMTAVHMLANMGWRDGIRLALKDKSRCDFTLRDGRGHLASYHAMVYGREPVVARLFRMLERQHGVVENARPSIRPPGPEPH